MPAPLEGLLHALNSGANVFDADQYAYFGGDDILAQLRKYDPAAHWTDTELGGGEGGSQGMGKRLDFDVSKLPAAKAGTAGLDLRSSNFGKLKNPNAVEHSGEYGDVTNSANVVKPKDPLWTKIAPLIVAMGGPAAAMALAGAGIGAGASAASMLGAGAGAEVGGSAAGAANWAGAAGGAAGGTAGVTGSGLTGVNTLGLPDWALSQIGKAPQVARSVNENGFNPMQFLPMVGQAFGINPSLASGGLTLASLANASRKRS